MSKEDMYLEIAKDLINDYTLDFGNAQAYVHDGYLFCSIEALNNTTISLPMTETKNVTRIDCRKEIAQAMIDAIRDFDPEEEFIELWSLHFSRCTGISPFRFVDMLRADSEYFNDTADRMEILLSLYRVITDQQ